VKSGNFRQWIPGSDIVAKVAQDTFPEANTPEFKEFAEAVTGVSGDAENTEENSCQNLTEMLVSYGVPKDEIPKTSSSFQPQPES
jgi:hypothetical protein